MSPAASGLVLWTVLSLIRAVSGDQHSLCYLYTIHFKISSKFCECTAVTLLDGIQLDFYNSSDHTRTPEHNWLKNTSKSDWKTITEKLDTDRQWLNKLIDMQMDKSRSEDHVLQWKHSCEGERHANGSVTVSTRTDLYGYDGEDLIYFNCTSNTWFTPEKQKNTEREEKWNENYGRRAAEKCDQSVEMLKIYLNYGHSDITPSHTPPDVHVFAKTAVSDSSKLTLTCMATGFFPKDVEMRLRKLQTSIPEHLLTSSGVRPNGDGTYQLRKSVEILQADKAKYDCYVSHRTLDKPIIMQWEVSRSVIIGAVFIGVAVVIACLVFRFYTKVKKKDNGGGDNQRCPNGGFQPVVSEVDNNNTKTEKEDPATYQPAASQPAASQPAATQPAATQPAASQPAATQPAASQPAATQPAAGQPAATQPEAVPLLPVSAASQPSGSQPEAVPLLPVSAAGLCCRSLLPVNLLAVNLRQSLCCRSLLLVSLRAV